MGWFLVISSLVFCMWQSNFHLQFAESELLFSPHTPLKFLPIFSISIRINTAADLGTCGATELQQWLPRPRLITGRINGCVRSGVLHFHARVFFHKFSFLIWFPSCFFPFFRKKKWSFGGAVFLRFAFSLCICRVPNGRSIDVRTVKRVLTRNSFVLRWRNYWRLVYFFIYFYMCFHYFLKGNRFRIWGFVRNVNRILLSCW